MRAKYHMTALIVGIPLGFICWWLIIYLPTVFAIVFMNGLILLMGFGWIARQRKRSTYYRSPEEETEVDPTPKKGSMELYVNYIDKLMSGEIPLDTTNYIDYRERQKEIE